MPKIAITNLAGDTRTIDAETGLSLMENIRNNDFDDLQALCGGCCSCCTCHVYVDTDWYGKLPTPQDDESDLVEDSEHFRDGESRLSCQIEVTDGMTGLHVTIAPEV
ncbi:2Fe-2S iron-sulfur cluster-binding protein [Eilatimonas milleporae]|uniref:2Fe-2S ferredoxin n=1 Tax=Eilatimonas milleporae TaxID=911205 RepID=A0A3M0BT04_9PROT|nr:2Fe-2S iron-sulfur cluster-binding protein [Eilatimonas milleporae]RMB00651.1 2Fe-2S ferredoxin [Eilatimonas milleporae]